MVILLILIKCFNAHIFYFYFIHRCMKDTQLKLHDNFSRTALKSYYASEKESMTIFRSY